MAITLSEKYRPQLLDQLKRDKAVETIRNWAKKWQAGKNEKSGLIIYGPPGTGKTSAAMALAKEMGWEYYELNASDVRSKQLLNKTAILTSQYYQISDEAQKMKLIVLDEVDSLYEKNEQGYDYGGKSAILDLLKTTRNPIILIANDLYSLKTGIIGKQIVDRCELVNFQRYRSIQIFSVLKDICLREKKVCPDDTLKEISEKANGDMRAAINDLEGFFYQFKGESRDTTENIYSLINDLIFSKRSIQDIKMAMINLGEDPNDLILYVLESVFQLNREKDKFVQALERLSRADVFLGEVSKKNNYDLWGYATDLISSISDIKFESSGNYIKSYPNLIRKMSEYKITRNIRRDLSFMGGRYIHKSSNFTSIELLPVFSAIAQRDEKFRKKMIERLGDIFDEIDSIEP